MQAVVVLCLLALAPSDAPAGGLRVATLSPGLTRDGPGLAYRDLLKGEAGALLAIRHILSARPDVLLLCGLDWDREGRALDALAGRLAQEGLDYRHRLALKPNTGMPTGLDLDGDGRLGGAGDAQGYGGFTGAAGMALLSRLAIREAAVADHSALLWRDLPGGRMPDLPAPEPALRRLSTTGHWVVPLALPDGRDLTVLAYCAGPPAFGRAQDNLWRNHDETAFWLALLDGRLGPPPEPPFVLMGDANLDPQDGDGEGAVMARLLSDPRLQDPRPVNEAARRDPTPGHRGDPALATADWRVLRSGRPGPGRLRVDYVLPSADLAVTDAGVIAPPERAAGRQGLVWVDLDLPGPSD